MRWGNKEVLVTGGASFISSHLVDKLVDLNAQVRIASSPSVFVILYTIERGSALR